MLKILEIHGMKERLREVEAYLEQALHFEHAAIREKALKTLHAGGKRVRPALAIMTAGMYGKEKEIIPTEYKITLDADGGIVEKTEIKFIENEKVTLPQPSKEGYIFKGWYEDGVLVETLENRNYTLKAEWEKEDTGIYTIQYKNTARSDWYIRVLENRDELVEEFYLDLYKWAKLNGETRTQEEYRVEVAEKLKNSEELKLIDPSLKDRENTKGGTEYFLNTSLFYNKSIFMGSYEVKCLHLYK